VGLSREMPVRGPRCGGQSTSSRERMHIIHSPLALGPIQKHKFTRGIQTSFFSFFSPFFFFAGAFFFSSGSSFSDSVTRLWSSWFFKACGKRHSRGAIPDFRIFQRNHFVTANSKGPRRPRTGAGGWSNLSQGYQPVCNLVDGIMVGHSRSHFSRFSSKKRLR
jgi:hypothetical protein